jgi:hypothetical protein
VHENDGRSKSERKKARRRQRATAERSGGKALIELADAAVDESVSLLDRIEAERELGLTTEMPTLAAAEYCRKRINEALGYREWLDEVEVWVWNGHTSTRKALTDAGAANGVELRLEMRVQHDHG